MFVAGSSNTRSAVPSQQSVFDPHSPRHFGVSIDLHSISDAKIPHTANIFLRYTLASFLEIGRAHV